MSRNDIESNIENRTNTTVKNPESQKPPVRLPWKTVTALGIVGVLAVGGNYAAGAINANMPKVVTEIEAPEVEATVKSVHVGIEPVTISTVVADTLTTIKKSDKTNILGMDVELRGTELRRAADVKAEYTFDPQTVEADYDKEAKQVTITVPDSTLNTEVSVETGTGRTEHISKTGIVGWVLDNTEQFLQYADGTLGTDSSKDELVSGVVNGTLGVNETLEAVADYQAAAAVDKSCTDEVRKIDGFNEALKDQVEILSVKEVLASEFLDELDLSSAERRELIENADVVFESGDDFTIGHDKEIATKVEAYNKIFSTGTKMNSVECTVNENTKFTVDGDQVNG